MNEEQRKNEVKKQGLYLRLNDGKFLKLRKKIKSYAEQFSDRELFESFYRADPSRTNPSQGSGLGLAIAKNIVEAHRGKIEASNNNGLTIVIKLPM